MTPAGFKFIPFILTGIDYPKLHNLSNLKKADSVFSPYYINYNP